MRIVVDNPNLLSSIIEELTNQKLRNPINGITTDSRDCKSGDLYIALIGKRNNGHDYLLEVENLNASAVLINNENFNKQLKIQQIPVNDTSETLGLIAKKWRNNFDIPIIAITGSNGKTSTKELLYYILKEKYSVHATKGNYNTSIGLPLSLLTLKNNHNISIIEMGANQPGDIKYLCDIAKPTHGLITNISPSHLEGFQAIENITNTKGELFKSLEGGICFFNNADERIKSISCGGKIISYGLNSDCDFSADIHHENDGSITLTINTKEIKTNSKNLAFAKNIIAVYAISTTLGIEWKLIQEKVLTFISPKGRCQVETYNSITIIDDTYNSNLESCISAIDYLKAFTGNGRRIVVLGDMLELGELSNEQHEKLGIKCSNSNLDAVFTIGKETISTQKAISGIPINLHYDNHNSLIMSLKSQLMDNDKILFKGSRGMKMEKVIAGVFKKQ